ncbi:CRP/FNR family transcriptional regulator [Catalinimonas alkaloidigena]|uniref:Crp/Fnr family transcriptional regulator n=1 Tax=Catalinimonas alkaloidigena TaxID=1075417 RepID=UPI0024067413|nr:Crp/Fnr family transcriptional regulator [Catalinimonas alkaloidigena]MDF9797566.1 CRP/FNR family transcriptional regulator [Catalinimonas alkaloidigena]
MEIDLKLIKQVFHISHPELLREIQHYGKWLPFAPGDTIINYGNFIKTVPLIISGTVKVIKEDEEGKEVFLYYLKSGETCAMSLTCCSTYQPSQIKAIAEDTTELIAIPVNKHEEWMNTYREWKELVGRTYSNRFQELLNTIESIAFKRMDERLLNYLENKFSQLQTNMINVTHQEIANELGTSREVVSRLLKQLEKNGRIVLGRNKVMLKEIV